ncbi:hypothetical protein CYR55_13490 [Chimaeribacter californicus]|uniref:Uncharacterized protein n=1 Tax=Chimaeribacter californicus TaxID=2060067 RepID=A0A2N5E3K7_9GAMM|nr:hypothetical protein [Chimaeribacter californicus]PLR35425.1 hypothetical protein CYR55_13490 [Chimaeribacter californicus]
MLRDHLQLTDSDTLKKIDHVRLPNQGQEEITVYQITDRHGVVKGKVSVYDKLNTRRSYPVDCRITQHDAQGRVIVDKLTESW